MIPLIGSLYRKQNMVVTIFGRGLVNKDTIEILKVHRHVRAPRALSALRLSRTCCAATHARAIREPNPPLPSFARKHVSPSITAKNSLTVLRAVERVKGLNPTRLDIAKTTLLCQARVPRRRRPPFARRFARDGAAVIMLLRCGRTACRLAARRDDRQPVA